MLRDVMRPGCLLALLLSCACGTAAQDRPRVVTVFPEHGSVLAGPLQEICFTYDDPVSLLNRFDVQVIVDGLFVPVHVFQRASDPASLYVRPASGTYFPTSNFVLARLNQGAVANDQRHYADVVYESYFGTGPEPSVPVGHPGLVSMLDAGSLALLSDHPTPAGRDAVGLLSTIRGATRRVWVQLDGGAGVGEALAWFDPASAAPMTVVALTTGTDLLAAVPCLLAPDDARWLYAAWRDTGSGRVRLARIDTGTGLEDGSIELESIPADPATLPVGIEVTTSGATLVVSADDGASGTLAFVQTSTFTELDRDPGLAGIQGLALPAGAGPLARRDALVYNADPGSSTVTQVDVHTLAITPLAGGVPGATVALARTGSGNLLFQALAAFAGTEALAQRGESTAFDVLGALALSDDVGGAPAGITDSIALLPYVGSERFLLLLDSGLGVVAARFTRTPEGTRQDDLDAATAGIQVLDVSFDVPNATCAGRTVGAFRP